MAEQEITVEFIRDRIERINNDLQVIDRRLVDVELEQQELYARRSVLKQALVELRKKQSQFARRRKRDTEMVRSKELQRYLDEYLDGAKHPYRTMQDLADRAGLSLGVLEKIRYKSRTDTRVEFNTADKLLTAMGLGHLLGTNIPVEDRQPLTDDP